jgi:hypothetical protein
MSENENQNDKPKIIVDEDWKAQAQAEKEKLAEEVEMSKEGGEDQQGRRIPPATFSTLINSLFMQSVMAMGGMQDPETGQRMVDIELAKYHIDTLSMLKEKTEGNLSEEEKQLLERALNELRMGYVSLSQQIEKAVQQQAQEQDKGQDKPQS